MQISLSIMQARKKQQMTQEDVANALGVSHVAVSKWERGVSYPDITLLPAIARLFHMSMDELFCFQEKLTKTEAKILVKELLENFQHMSMQEALSLCKECVKQYPSDMELLSMLGNSIWRGLMYAKKEEEMLPVIAYAEEILMKVKDSGDMQMHDSACASLSNIYLVQGRMQEALEVLDEIAQQDIDASQLKAGIYLNQNDYKKAKEMYDAIMLKNIMNVRMCLIGLSTMATLQKDGEKVIKTVKQIEELLALFEIDVPLANEYLQCTRVCIEQRKHTEGKEYLKKCLHSLCTKVAYPAFSIKEQKEPLQSLQEVAKNFLRVLLTEPDFHEYLLDPEIQTLVDQIQKDVILEG